MQRRYQSLMLKMQSHKKKELLELQMMIKTLRLEILDLKTQHLETKKSKVVSEKDYEDSGKAYRSLKAALENAREELHQKKMQIQSVKTQIAKQQNEIEEVKSSLPKDQNLLSPNLPFDVVQIQTGASVSSFRPAILEPADPCAHLSFSSESSVHSEVGENSRSGLDMVSACVAAIKLKDPENRQDILNNNQEEPDNPELPAKTQTSSNKKSAPIDISKFLRPTSKKESIILADYVQTATAMKSRKVAV